MYLGSIGAAHNKASLEAAGITHVLTVAGGLAPRFPDEYTYCLVDVADSPSEPLHRHFDRCLKFIARALLDGGRVLVHCFAGKSRSSTVVAAYAMATEGTTLKDTMDLHHRREARRVAERGVHASTARLRGGARGGAQERSVAGENTGERGEREERAGAVRGGCGGGGGGRSEQLGEPIRG